LICLALEGDERVFVARGALGCGVVAVTTAVARDVASFGARGGMLPASSSRFGKDSALRSGAPGAPDVLRLPFDDVVVDDRLSPDSDESARAGAAVGVANAQ
jgi:hypothetical protein